MDKAFLSVENLILKRNNATIISELSFCLPYNHNLCITGSLASGKSTLLEALSGNIPIYSGIVCWHGLAEVDFIYSNIAFISQRYKLPVHYIEDQYYQRRFNSTALDNIPTVSHILQNITQEDSLLHRVIEDTHLAPLLEMPYMLLSNGQTRRLAIACALLKVPKFIILDQPFTGLDHYNSLLLAETLNHLSKKNIHYILSGEIPKEIQLEDLILLDIDKCSTTKRELTADKEAIQLKITAPSQGNAAIAIAFKDLNVQYGDNKVFTNFNWTILHGQHWLLQGDNGSGKSTLLSLIYADHPQAYSNDIYILDKKRGSGESIWDIKRYIGFFSPELMRYYEKPISVLQVIFSGYSDTIGIAHGMLPEHKDIITAMLKKWQIADLAERTFTQLSFGEQRMVLILRALVKDPEILLLDEPLQGLDNNTLEAVKTWILSCCMNKTLIYIAHHPSEMLPFYDGIIKL